jgi:predicted naringenin-chalcone synthase
VPGNVYLNAIGTAVPDHEAHSAFIGWAQPKIADPRLAKLFGRMVARSGIEHRWTVLPRADDGGSPIGPGGFYENGFMPGTDARMRVYAEQAPALSLEAIDRLAEQVEIDRITHLVVASCTGFIAPGVDQIVARRLGLAPSVERLLVGFMGCYAAVAALRSARHIVRSEPGARVLVVCVELCSLHLQDTGEIEKLLAMLQFGDGAGAALVTSDAAGFELEAPFATTLPDSDRLIRWDITDKRCICRAKSRNASLKASPIRTSPLPLWAGARSRRSTAGQCMPAGARSSTRSRPRTICRRARSGHRARHCTITATCPRRP